MGFLGFLLAAFALYRVVSAEKKIRILDKQFFNLTLKSKSGEEKPAPAPQKTPTPERPVQTQAAPVERVEEVVAPEPAPVVPRPSPPPSMVTQPYAPIGPKNPTQPKNIAWMKILSQNFEEKVAGRLSIWLGAFAIVMAGGYFLKYSLDQGLLSPTVRIIMGLATAFVMLGAAEYFYRRGYMLAQGLSAGAIGLMFGSFWSAVSLYHLISPLAGFVALAAASVLGVVLSLRHGPVVAIIGLVGGYMTPMLVGSSGSHPAILFTYLIGLLVGISYIARRQGWFWLISLAAAFINIWAVVWLLFSFDGNHASWFGLFIAAGTLVITFVGMGGKDVFPERYQGLGQVIRVMRYMLKFQAGLSLVILILPTLHSGVDFIDRSWLVLMGVSCMALDRLRSDYSGYGWVGMGVPFGVYLMMQFGPGHIDREQLRWLVIEFALVFTILPFLFIWWRAKGCGGVAGKWATMSVTAALGYFIASFFGMGQLDAGLWAMFAAVVTLLFAGVIFMVRKKTDYLGGEGALAVYFGGANLFMAFASYLYIPQIAQGYWVATAFAVQLIGLAWIEGRGLNPFARFEGSVFSVVRTMGMLLFASVFVMAMKDGFIMYDDIEEVAKIFLLPSVLMVAAVIIFLKKQDSEMVNFIEWAISVMLFSFASLSVYLSWDNHGTDDLYHVGTYPIVWLLCAVGGWLCYLKWPRAIFSQTNFLLCLFAAVGSVVMVGLRLSPLGNSSVTVEGVLLFNGYAYASLIPALLLLCAGYLRSRREGPARVPFLSAMATFLLLSYITVEVRHMLYGPEVAFGKIDMAFIEFSLFAICWFALGAVYYFFGRRFNNNFATQAAGFINWGVVIWIGVTCLLVANPLAGLWDVGGGKIFNLLIPHYGLTVIIVALVANVLHREANIMLRQLAGVLCVLLLLMLITTEVRQILYGSQIAFSKVSMAFLEFSVFAICWFALGAIYYFFGRRFSNDFVIQAARSIGWGVVIWIAVTGFLVANPFMEVWNVGDGKIFNLLIPHYGLTMIIVAVVANIIHRDADKILRQGAGVLCLALLLMFVSTEVRQWFQGGVFAGHSIGDVEQYSYSIVWLLTGALLMVPGVMKGLAELRYGALAVIALSIFKVFLYDTAHLEGLYRVASLLGLGLSLFALSFVYQKFVAPKKVATG